MKKDVVSYKHKLITLGARAQISCAQAVVFPPRRNLRNVRPQVLGSRPEDRPGQGDPILEVATSSGRHASASSHHGSTATPAPPNPRASPGGGCRLLVSKGGSEALPTPLAKVFALPPSAARTIGPIAATWPSCGGRSGARENPETSSMETEAALLLRIAGHCAVTIFFSAAAPLAAATNPASVSTRTWHERDRRRQASAASQPA